MNELHALPRQQQYGADKKRTLPSRCRDCSVQFLCNGGRPKNRFAKASRRLSGEEGLNHLCTGDYEFFRHAEPYVKVMAREYAQGRSPANVMRYIQRHPDSFKPDDIGRNDPYYCGTGKRYKYCCL